MELKQHQIDAMVQPDTYVPAHLRDGLIAYLEVGRSVGSFLAAVLCNDLRMACMTAKTGVDDKNIITLTRWLWNHAPIQAHGSESNYHGWMDARSRDIAAQNTSNVHHLAHA